jgi:hypothetical protein
MVRKIRINLDTARLLDWFFWAVAVGFAAWADWRICVAFLAFDLMRVFEDIQKEIKKGDRWKID